MYGLLLKNMAEYVMDTYGEKIWKKAMEALKIDENEDFPVEKVYPEGQLLKLGKKVMQLTGTGEEEFYEGMGMNFVDLTQKQGYSYMIKLLGRHLRDFILNLDNLHDYLKHSFPRLKAPSFFIRSETAKGMILEYRSKRRGFHYYVQGQIKAIAKKNFDLSVEIHLLKTEVIDDTVVCTYDLKFNNEVYINSLSVNAARKEASLPIRASTIFEIFPFCILFQENMTVTCIGSVLRHLIPGIVGKKLPSYFQLLKPLIEFQFEDILSHHNNMFELTTTEDIGVLNKTLESCEISQFENDLEQEISKALSVKGQMLYIQEWHQILFIACPIIQDLGSLMYVGLFINELSLHDYSRDILLASSQEQIEIRMSLDVIESRSKTINNRLQELDEIKKRTNELLYQMIPKSVAERLQKGTPAMSTCEVFECVTMLFSDIVGFTTICSRIKPSQVVNLLNNLYTLFDFLVDQNAVYKVETIGDAYLIVSGCPIKAGNHAVKICDMAFDMMDGIKILKDPGTGQDIEMRIGCHSGQVVAGVVGNKMPRYCLFGFNVGITEKLESNSKPMRIHISEPCRKLLTPQYKTEERKEEGLLEKIGGLKSYFLTHKENRKPLKTKTLEVLLPTETEKPTMDKESAPSSNDVPPKASSTNKEDDLLDKEPLKYLNSIPMHYNDKDFCGGFQTSGACNIL